MILTHGANSIARGGVNPEKSFVLDIDRLDLDTMRQDNIQFYGPGTKRKVNGHLRLTNACTFTFPLEDSEDYLFEMVFNIVELRDFMYPCARTFIQGGELETPWGVCMAAPYENLYIKPGLNYNTSWTGWGYTFQRWLRTNDGERTLKFSERCEGSHYIQKVNDVITCELDSLIDYPNLTGDANYNTTSGNGLNKAGFAIEDGTADIISMRFERYD